MLKEKVLLVSIIPIMLFSSCNDVTSSDKNKEQIVVNPQPINAKVGESFSYEGDVTNGPASDIFVSFKQEFSENVEDYNEWLSVRLTDNGDKYIIEGNPKMPGDYHFRLTVQRGKDFNLDVGSYVTGFNVNVD